MQKMHSLAASILFVISSVALGQDTSSSPEANQSNEDGIPPQTSPAQGNVFPSGSVVAGDSVSDVNSIPVEAVSAPEAPEKKEDRDRQRLDDIIVTATKREKSAREIPVSINAMYGEDLEKQGARDLKDYITLVPGITLQEGAYGEAGDRRITIRGVGPGDLGGQSGNQTVGQFIGDVPLTDPYANFVAPDLDPYDLKTVEILKGPQGTTFGASALNGAIRYVPNTPELSSWAARGFVDRLSIKDGGADFTYGTAVNVPIGDQVALRGVGVLQNTPGVYDNLKRDTPDADSRRKWSARGMARWDASDRSTTVLMYQKQKSRYDDSLLANNPDGDFTNDNHPGVSGLDVSFELASIDTRYEFDDWGTLVLQGSAQNKRSVTDFDAAFTGSYNLESVRAFADYKTKGYTGEVRLVSPDGGNWNWIVGAFMQDYSIDASADVYVANTADLAILAGLPGAIFTTHGISVAQAFVVVPSKETSLYGELARRLGEKWEVTVGARFYNTELAGERSVAGLLSTAYLGGTTEPIQQKEHGLSPKMALTFKPSDNLMTYVSASRGFQFGGANAPPIFSLPYNNPVTGVPVPVDFKSSVLWSYEAGIRTDWFDRTLRIDLTGFYLDWSKAQFGQSSGGAVLSNTYTDNVGKVHSRGVEGTIAYLTPVPGLTLNLAGSYIRATTAAPYDPGSGDVIPPGTDMPATPHVQTVASLQYSLTVGPWVSNTSFTHSHWSKAYNNIAHLYEIYDFQLMNANFSISRPDWAGLPTLTIGVTNIADERATMNRIASTALSEEAWVYARPRALSLRFSADFN